jgi:hypothetical protein
MKKTRLNPKHFLDDYLQPTAFVITLVVLALMIFSKPIKKSSDLNIDVGLVEQCSQLEDAIPNRIFTFEKYQLSYDEDLAYKCGFTAIVKKWPTPFTFAAILFGFLFGMSFFHKNKYIVFVVGTLSLLLVSWLRYESTFLFFADNYFFNKMYLAFIALCWFIAAARSYLAHRVLVYGPGFLFMSILAFFSPLQFLYALIVMTAINPEFIKWKRS